MGRRKLRRTTLMDRNSIVRRFEKQRRRNLLAQPGPLNHVIILDHLKPLFNIGKIFRSADAFGVREVHLVGTEYFDPAPAKGSFKWVPARFHKTFAACHENLKSRGYTIYLLQPDTEERLDKVVFPEKSAFVFGHEEFGFSFDPELYSDSRPLTISQLGHVQSLNVSIAASLVMHEYMRQHKHHKAVDSASPSAV